MTQRTKKRKNHRDRLRNHQLLRRCHGGGTAQSDRQRRRHRARRLLSLPIKAMNALSAFLQNGKPSPTLKIPSLPPSASSDANIHEVLSEIKTVPYKVVSKQQWRCRL